MHTDDLKRQGNDATVELAQPVAEVIDEYRAN